MTETSAAIIEKDFQEAKKMLHDLFEIMQIQHLIVVDDELSTPLDVEVVIGAVQLLVGDPEHIVLPDITEIKGIDFGAPIETWSPKLRAAWEKIGLDRRDEIALLLNAPAATNTNESGRSILDRLLGDVKPRFLNLTEWRAQSAQLIAAAGASATLFLFDQDMTKNPGGQPEEGMRIISDLIKGHAQNPNIYFGLFSNTVEVNEEFEQHLAHVKKWKLENASDRFAVISKRGLDTKPSDLACRLKRVAISPRCSALKNGIFTAINEAVEEAKRKIEELHIYDFEHIVFRSSYKEGVWEVDTLLRLFGVYFQEAARAKAASNPAIRKAADDVRKVISFPYRPTDAPERRAREIARLEMYESREYLLNHRIPIEVGDIFQKTKGKQQYILLEQPCDLMIRGGDDADKGRRGVEHVTLAEIFKVKKGGKVPEASFMLDNYSIELQNEQYVRLERCFTIPICIIDLCVCSDDGVARFEQGKSCPDGMIPAWRERYGKLQTLGGKLLAKYQGLIAPKGREPVKLSGPVDELLQLSITQSVPNLVAGVIDLQKKRIDYTIQRVGKLKQPWAGGLLRDYAFHRARDAFDHDIKRPLDDEAAGQVESHGEEQRETIVKS